MTKLKSAVIGCGRMGAFTSESVKKYSPKCWLPLSHIEALNRCSYTFVDSVCDINKKLLQDVKLLHEIENTYTDHQILLEQTKPDLVTIATRTIDRTSIIKDIIKAGTKAIHTEKPFCNSMLQLNELSKYVKDNNVLLTYGTIRRYFDIYQKAKKIVGSGKLGELKEIEINFGFSQLFWSHPHSVDTILFFANSKNIVSVQACLDNVIQGEVDDLIISDPYINEAKIVFDDGCIGKITSKPGMDVILYCSKGRITVEGDGKKISIRKLDESMSYYEDLDEVYFNEKDNEEGTMAAIQHLINKLKPETISDGNPINFDETHIFTGQLILFGFAQSHLDGGVKTDLNDVRSSINILAKTGNFFA